MAKKEEWNSAVGLMVNNYNFMSIYEAARGELGQDLVRSAHQKSFDTRATWAYKDGGNRSFILEFRFPKSLIFYKWSLFPSYSW